MSARRALLLVNEKARRGLLDISALRLALEKGGMESVLETPENAEEMDRLIRRDGPNFDVIVIGGGDGTINGAAGALLAARRPFGILPLGTGNDLARTLGIPPDPLAAADIIKDGYHQPIDLGMINDRYFFNVASLGLSVRLTRALDYQLKQRWGPAGYFLALLRLELGRGFNVEIDSAVEKLQLRAVQVSVGNGRHHGGGATVAADARIDDGKLHLYAIPHLPKWHLALILPLLRLGRQHLSKTIKTLEGEWFDIRTIPSLRVNTDGEVTTSTPAHVKVLRGALRAVVPRPSS